MIKPKDISKALNISNRLASHWLSSKVKYFKVADLLKLKENFGIPVEAWLDIKSWLQTDEAKKIFQKLEQEEANSLEPQILKGV